MYTYIYKYRYYNMYEVFFFFFLCTWRTFHIETETLAAARKRPPRIQYSGVDENIKNLLVERRGTCNDEERFISGPLYSSTIVAPMKHTILPVTLVWKLELLQSISVFLQRQYIYNMNRLILFYFILFFRI